MIVGEKIYWTPNVCFDLLYKYTWNNFHSKKNWARYDLKMYAGLHVKYPLFSSDYDMCFFKKMLKYFYVCPEGAELFHVDGQTDMTKLIFVSSNFCERTLRDKIRGQSSTPRTDSESSISASERWRRVHILQCTGRATVLSLTHQTTAGECRVQLKRDGTWWRTGGEVKGKLANGGCSQYFSHISEHSVSSITLSDAHTSAASTRLNWRPRRFKWTRPFRWKTKSGFCACAITFQTQSTYYNAVIYIKTNYFTVIESKKG
jgi:hypothetical protein